MLPPPPSRSDPPRRRHRASHIQAPKSKVQRSKWVLTNFDLPTKHLTDPNPPTRRTLTGRDRSPSRRHRAPRAPHLAATTQRPTQRPISRSGTQRPIFRTQRPISTTQRPKKKNFRRSAAISHHPLRCSCTGAAGGTLGGQWGVSVGRGAVGPRRGGGRGEGKGREGGRRGEGEERGKRGGRKGKKKKGGPGGDPAATQRPTPTQRLAGPNAQNRTVPYGDPSSTAWPRRHCEAVHRVWGSSDHCSPPRTTQRPRDPTPNA